MKKLFLAILFAAAALAQPPAFDAALSPDGRMLLYASPGKDANTSRIVRVAVDGTDEKEMFTIPSLRAATCTSDSRGVLFIQFDEKQTGRITRTSEQGGPPEFTGISADRLGVITPSPDGSKIAYRAALGDREVWAIDNVLAGLK